MTLNGTIEPWETASQYLGVPFVHMGRSRMGLDCVGLLLLTAWDRGWKVEDKDYYGRAPARNNNSFQLQDHLRSYLGEPVDRPLQVNDIVLLTFRPRFAPSHVGIVAPHKFGLALIHTNGIIGQVKSQRIDERRLKQIVEVYPWPAKR